MSSEVQSASDLASVMISPYQAALIAGGFTIAGVLLGAFVTYYFASRIARANARREAGRRLREASATELAEMDSVSGVKNKDVGLILQNAFPKHRTAVVEFAFYLSPLERAKFDQAWRAYHEVGGSVRFFDYTMGERPRELFKERVGEILRYAEI